MPKYADPEDDRVWTNIPKITVEIDRVDLSGDSDTSVTVDLPDGRAIVVFADGRVECWTPRIVTGVERWNA